MPMAVPVGVRTVVAHMAALGFAKTVIDLLRSTSLVVSRMKRSSYVHYYTGAFPLGWYMNEPNIFSKIKF